jgi:hypothetical protein
MSPIITAEFVNSRMAELRCQAERHRMIHAARRARRDSGLHTASGRTASGLARRALAMLSPRSPRPARW